jgi:hypothetical protein
MYKVTVVNTRPNADIPFIWETNLIDYPSINDALHAGFGDDVTFDTKVYSDDRLVATQTFLSPSMEIYYQAKGRVAVDKLLINFWIVRDNYNFDNNIFRQSTEEEI